MTSGRLLPCLLRPIWEKHPGSPQTIKQHLAAIKMLFDYLVISQIVPTNPAAPVKGPTDVVKRGKTPVLSVEDARTLLDSIPTDSLQGLRDRALIGVMLFSFARVRPCKTSAGTRTDPGRVDNR